MQPKDEEAFQRAVERRATQQDPTSKLLYEKVDGWQVMSSNQASIDAFKAANAQDGPVLADDESFSQAMDDYPDARDLQGVRERQDGDGRDAQDASGRPGEVPRQGRQPRLDRRRPAHDLRRHPLRHHRSRHARQSLLRSSTGGDATPNFELSLPKQLPADVLAYIGFHGTTGTFKGLESNPILEVARAEAGALGRRQDRHAGRGRERAVRAQVQRRHPGDHARHHAARRHRRRRDARRDPRRTRTSARRPSRRRSPAPTRGASSSATPDRRSTTRRSATSSSSRPCRPASRPSPTPGHRIARARCRTRSTPPSVPDKVQSFFYVDIRGGLGLVEQLSGAPIPDAVKKNVKPLRSAVEYAASRPSEVQLTFFVRIDSPTRLVASRAGLPERLLARRVRGAGEHEEQVREAVQVDGRQRVDGPLARGGERLALGAAAGGAGDVQARGGLGAAGQDEAPQLGQRRRSRRRCRPRAARPARP